MSRDDAPGRDAVEAFLDRAFDDLAGTGAAGRSAYAEIEDHLRESTMAAEARGLPPGEAARDAVARFGSVENVTGPACAYAARADLRVLRRVTARLARRALAACAVVIAWGLIAVGVAGLAVAMAGLTFGRAVVADVGLDLGECGRPATDAATRSCAWVEQMFDDRFALIVEHRLMAGALGLALLAVLRVLSHRPFVRARWLPSPAMVGVIGATAAGAVGVVTLAYGIRVATSDLPLYELPGWPLGAGDPLTLAVVALPTAVIFVARCRVHGVRR